MSVGVITLINKPFVKHMFECKGSHLQALILQSFLFTVYEIVKKRSCFVNVYCIMYNYQYAVKKLFRSFNHDARNNLSENNLWIIRSFHALKTFVLMSEQVYIHKMIWYSPTIRLISIANQKCGYLWPIIMK